MLIGRLSAEEATRRRVEATNPGRAPTAKELRDSVVRHSTAGRFREGHFAVIHTPGRIVNGEHATVVWPDDDPMAHQQVPWPAEVRARFTACFNE